MKAFRRAPLFLAVALASSSVAAQEDKRPLATRWALDYSGSVELGVGYVSDENFEFGEYNGLDDDDAYVIGSADWSGGSDGSLWNLSGRDLGLDTREASGRWRNDRWEFFFEYDGQRQVRNNTGRTPFGGGDTLLLPNTWVSGVNTSDFSALNASLRDLDLETERDIYTLGLSYQLSSAISLEGSVAYEERDGKRERGAAIAPNLSAGDAVLLPVQIDEEKLTVDLAVNFASDSLVLTGSFFYNDYDNQDERIAWQNPYANFGPDIAYPNGFGALSEEPDNEYWRARLMGTWVLAPTLRVQLDTSYAKTEQDQNFLPYTINPGLLAQAAALPRSNLDGELETLVTDARVFWNPWRKLRLEGYWHGEERDWDMPRDGYQYVMADSFVIPDTDGRLYNTAHDYSVNTYGVEGSYPLPLKSKLWLTYEYEEFDRDNTAVEKSEEDRYKLRYRLPIVEGLNMRLEALYGDRNADLYDWSQSYFARLDVGRINATPDSQRYLNHPLLSQYHIASREQTQAKLDFDWQVGSDWNLALNLLYRENDYDETELGLTDDELDSASFTASWIASEAIVVNAWVSASQVDTQQTGRAFRGGAEKNAFEIFPPLPQASDPARNWDVDVEDEVLAVGVGVDWQVNDRMQLSAHYSYQDTDSDYDFKNGGAADLSADPLPADYDSTMHHVLLEGAWHFRDNLSIALNYQYWNYDSDDWAIQDVAPDTIDKVLSLGMEPADEDLHYIGTSIIYRWQ